MLGVGEREGETLGMMRLLGYGRWLWDYCSVCCTYLGGALLMERYLFPDLMSARYRGSILALCQLAIVWLCWVLDNIPRELRFLSSATF